jgi:hypothetical protein
MAFIIKKQADPFKKYWWLILLAFGLVGLWVCYPAFNSSSASVALAEQGLHPINQSLDSTRNPNGAPGGPVDLSMKSFAAYGKKALIDPFASLLFSPPSPAKAPAAASPSKKSKKQSSQWADALASLAAKGQSGTAVAASPVLSAAFPKGNFSSLSGLGGSESSNAFAPAGGAAGGGLSGFGSHTPKIGISYAHGTSNAGSPQSNGGGAMGALKNASAQMKSAALASNGTQAGALSSQIFDGGALGTGLIKNPKGMSNAVGIGQGTPMNLKANNPNLNKSKPQAVPAMPPAMMQQPSMMQQIMTMLMMSVVGGLAGGVVKAALGAMAL